MAQESLDSRDRRPDLDQLAGEGVPELMTRQVQASAPTVRPDLQLDAGNGDRGAESVGEHERMRHRGARSEPIEQRTFGIGGQVHHALPTPFAEHLQPRALPRMLGKQTVRYLEPLYFADAQPSAEHKEHERPITRRVDRLQEPPELLVSQIAWQRLGRSEVVPPWVHGIPPRGVKKLSGPFGLKFKPHAQRYEAAVDGGPGSPQGLLPDDELINVPALHLGQWAVPPGEKDPDVADVMNDGGRPGKPPAQISRERGDGIDHMDTPGGGLSPTLHQRCWNLM